MCDLGVELNTIERFGVMRYRGIWRSCCTTNDMELLRHLGELVAVRHPDLRTRLRWDRSFRQLREMTHLQLIAKILEKRIHSFVLATDLGYLDLGEAILSMIALGDLALHVPGHLLL